MTIEQAIIELRDLISDGNTDRENEALVLAIEKLRDKRPTGDMTEEQAQKYLAVIPPDLIKELAETVVKIITDIDWKAAIDKYLEADDD